MKVTLQTTNLYNTNHSNRAQSFTANPAQAVGETVAKSRLFDPVKKAYNKYLVDWLAKNYFARGAKSKAAGWLAEKTAKMGEKGDMTKHMAAIGATLISGMYVTRTLNNDKLDPEKRKTLAINDGLTWAFSTAGSYALDKGLTKWCDKVTTRFAANYLNKHPESRNIELLGNWKPDNINSVVESATKTISEKYEQMKASLSPEEFSKWLKKVNMKEKHFEYIKENPIKSVIDLNTQVLKDQRLDTMLNGIGVLKTLFVFGMIYRYIVPVLIMKPANKIGNYLHDKKSVQQQPAFEGVAAQKVSEKVDFVNRPRMSDFLGNKA